MSRWVSLESRCWGHLNTHTHVLQALAGLIAATASVHMKTCHPYGEAMRNGTLESMEFFTMLPPSMATISEFRDRGLGTRSAVELLSHRILHGKKEVHFQC